MTEFQAEGPPDQLTDPVSPGSVDPQIEQTTARQEMDWLMVLVAKMYALLVSRGMPPGEAQAYLSTKLGEGAFTDVPLQTEDPSELLALWQLA